MNREERLKLKREERLKREADADEYLNNLAAMTDRFRELVSVLHNEQLIVLAHRLSKVGYEMTAQILLWELNTRENSQAANLPPQ